MLVTIEGIDGSGKTTVEEALRDSYDGAFFTTEPTAPGPHENEFGWAVRQAIKDDATPPMAVLFTFLADHANHIETILRPALDSHDLVVCDRYIDSRMAYQGYALDGAIAEADQFLDELRERHEATDNYPEIAVSEVAAEAPASALFFAYLARLTNGGNEGLHPVLQSGDETVNLVSELDGHPLEAATRDPCEFLASIHQYDEALAWVRHLHEYSDWSRFPDQTLLLDIPVEVSFERKAGDEKEVFEKRDFLTAVRENYLDLADIYPERYTVIDATASPEDVQDACVDALDGSATAEATSD